MSTREDRLRERIKTKDLKMSALLDLTMAINENASVEELLDLYRVDMADSLQIECMALYAREDGEWNIQMKYGIGGKLPMMDDIRFEELQADIQLPETYRKWTKNKFDYVVPVYHDEEPLACLMVGDITERKNKVSPVVKHMRYIQTLTNVLVVAIRNKRLMADSLKQEMMKRELELAAEMQASLVPQHLPHNEHFEVDAYYRPHSSIGGDYYDFVQINDKEFVVVMADVSGKGASAALLMANFQANMRAIFTYCDLSLEQTIQELNKAVMRSAKGEKFITFFVAHFNWATNEMKYVNCGHNPPILIEETGEIELLSLGSFGLGMFDSIPKINMGCLPIKPGSILFCYTDGLVETESNESEEWGMERLINYLKTHIKEKPAEIITGVIHELDAFSGDSGFIDDTAILTCRIA